MTDMTEGQLAAAWAPKPPPPDYCDGHRGHRVFRDGARFVKCECCDELFTEVPYEVGPGSIPLHRPRIDQHIVTDPEGDGP